MTTPTFEALSHAQDVANGYVFGFFIGVGTMLLVDILHYRATKRSSRKR